MSCVDSENINAVLTSSDRVSIELQAGPTVATILVRASFKLGRALFMDSLAVMGTMERAGSNTGVVVNMFVVLVVGTRGKIAYPDSVIRCEPYNRVTQAVWLEGNPS